MARDKDEIALVEGADVEIIANARMLCAELSRHRATLVGRGIECDMLCWDSGRVEMNAERVSREKL